ncbi:C40 family peptidase [Paenibacillus guangzhouensis]|uniref:C40 family peptidase n=1 Tax=Paenibacillus guangzhouensis TaxID=1473112 RepID=UPI001266D87F|nr:C40 family peptidase [Paenibacillus guangzhouensis]
MKNTTFIKKLIVLGLSATIGLAGTLTFQSPHQAYAAQTGTANASALSASTKATRIINLGEKFMGRKYQFGAPTTSTRTFDCSSFTKYLYKQYGVNLPRSSIKQSKVGKTVSKSNLRKGDLVFFSTTNRNGKGKVNHVAIYAGNGRLLHTYGKPGVTYSNMNSGIWKKSFVVAKRVLS